MRWDLGRLVLDSLPSLAALQVAAGYMQVSNMEDDQTGINLSRWLHAAKEDGLILAAPSPSYKSTNVPPHMVGVRLAYLRQLVESLEDTMNDLYTTSTLAGKLILPLTARAPWNKKARFFNFIQSAP
eukprot:gene21010-27869_t